MAFAVTKKDEPKEKGVDPRGNFTPSKKREDYSTLLPSNTVFTMWAILNDLAE